MPNARHSTDRERIKSRVRAIIREQLEHDEAEYDTENLENLAELGIDSLSFVEVIFQIEEVFGVKSGSGFIDEQLYNVQTMDNIADLLVAAQVAG
jgi:acyl carrier protein